MLTELAVFHKIPCWRLSEQTITLSCGVMSETLFISDLHLDPSRPEITRLFVSFLRDQAPKADALYILGDLFEVWLGDDDSSPHNQAIIDALHELTTSGTPVYLMHGNRDFLMGEVFEQRAGGKLLPEPSVIDLYGTPTLILHGDTLCTDDVAYQEFRSMVRDPQWQQQFLSHPIEERARIAGEVRDENDKEKALKTADIMDVNTDAVIHTFREHNINQIIHGHTHRPAIHDLDVDGNAAKRIVLGDWYTQGSVLRCSATGCVLENC